MSRTSLRRTTPQELTENDNPRIESTVSAKFFELHGIEEGRRGILGCGNLPNSEHTAAYSFPGRSNRPLAQFLPALGQIWILPDCPGSLLTQIRSHEVQHYNDCGLQAAQLLHLRHVLLNRPLPEPYRFHDLMEASYVLGLTLSAGFPPDRRFFPPAPQPTTSLAEKIALLARKIAKSSHPQLGPTTAQIEAARAILFLLHHVIPARAGLGGDVVQEIGGLNLPRDWRNRWELQIELHAGLQRRVFENKINSFMLTMPVDPHRNIGEILVFLAHCLVPEYQKAVVKTLPTLVNLFSLGAIVSIPLVRIRREKNFYRADISVIHQYPKSEAGFRQSLDTQSGLLQRYRQDGFDCICTRQAVRILKAAQRCRQSTHPNRLSKYLRHFLDQWNFSELMQREFSCLACKAHLQASTVREALEKIKLAIPPHQHHLIEAANHYEAWLFSECLDLIQRTHLFPHPIRATKQFRYL